MASQVSNMDYYSMDLDALLLQEEAEHLEFKSAISGFSFDKLREYCVALANERGGVLVLGISDQKPRTVLGTNAFTDFRVKLHALTSQFSIRIEAKEEILHDKRVLRVKIPSRPIGIPLQVDGKYLMRAGESLVPMTSDLLKVILSEVETDFSAQIVPNADISHLDSVAISQFRELWQRRGTNLFVGSLPNDQVLRDVELLIEDQLTYAALLLFGTKSSLSRFLPQAEVVFEFRSDEEAIRHQQRVEFREGFLSFDKRLWDLINLRNEVQQIQDGFFVTDVQTFNEAVVREAILNAISHRDYRLQSSIFIKQTGKKLEITSPGGFPPGITSQNLLYKQFPRNRRLAEGLQKCGLIERSGQGVDTIFRRSLSEGKILPDYSRSDNHEVSLKLDGQIYDPKFVGFLNQVAAESGFSVSTDDTLLLDEINRGKGISETLRPRLARLIDFGVVERFGSGRGTKYVLSRRFYASIGRPGAYTHKRGLDRTYRKALVLSHIRQTGERGARLAEMQDVLPSSTKEEIKSLLRELKESQEILLLGRTNGARWYPANLSSKTQ